MKKKFFGILLCFVSGIIIIPAAYYVKNQVPFYRELNDLSLQAVMVFLAGFTAAGLAASLLSRVRKTSRKITFSFVVWLIPLMSVRLIPQSYLYLFLCGFCAGFPFHFLAILYGKKFQAAVLAGVMTGGGIVYAGLSSVFFRMEAIVLYLFLLLLAGGICLKIKWMIRYAASMLLLLAVTYAIVIVFPPSAEEGTAAGRPDDGNRMAIELVSALILTETELPDPKIAVFPADSPLPETIPGRPVERVSLNGGNNQADTLILFHPYPCSPAGEYVFSAKGIASLKKHLNQDGILAIPLNIPASFPEETEDRISGMILAAVRTQFRHTVLFTCPTAIIFASDSEQLTDDMDILAKRAETLIRKGQFFPLHPSVLNVTLPIAEAKGKHAVYEKWSREPAVSFSSLLAERKDHPALISPYIFRFLRESRLFFAALLLAAHGILRYFSAYRPRFRECVESTAGGIRCALVPSFLLFCNPASAAAFPDMGLMSAVAAAVMIPALLIPVRKQLYFRIPSLLLMSAVVLIPEYSAWLELLLIGFSAFLAGCLMSRTDPKKEDGGQAENPFRTVCFSVGLLLAVFLAALFSAAGSPWESAGYLMLFFL